MSVSNAMKFRVMLSVGIGLLLFLFVPVKWLVVADYAGEPACNFVLSGFPLPYIVDWGIISRFGNSGDTAVSYLNLSVDVLFYIGLTFGVTFLRGKVYTQPSQAMKVTSVILCVAGLICFAGSLWLMLTFGDLHSWFQNGYTVETVEFFSADGIFRNMK